MIDIDGKIISTDILTERFCCDLGACRGVCCVEGDSGAPIEPEEAGILEKEFDNYKPYMTPEGIDAVEKQGFMVVDSEGDFTTPLVRGAECAFSFNSGGNTMCAIEKAFIEGKTFFRKPSSCHLYPIRVKRFSDGTFGLNLHRWDICRSAFVCGVKRDMPVYKWLREAITDRFGHEFYDALDAAARYIETYEEN